MSIANLGLLYVQAQFEFLFSVQNILQRHPPISEAYSLRQNNIALYSHIHVSTGTATKGHNFNRLYLQDP